MDPRAEPYGSLEDDGKRGIVILAHSAGIHYGQALFAQTRVVIASAGGTSCIDVA